MIEAALARALPLAPPGWHPAAQYLRAAHVSVPLLLSASATSAAERNSTAGPDSASTPGWVPRHVQLGTTDVGGWALVTAADAAAVSTRLFAVEELLWRQLTKEEFLRREIRKEEQQEADHNSTYAKEIAQESPGTPCERRMAGAPSRQQDREAMIATVAASEPAQAAKMRSELEKSQREVTAQLAASGNRDRQQVRIDAQVPTFLEIERKRLAALTPAERTEPAWITPQGAGFVGPAEPGAQRLIRPNADFFRQGSGLASDALAAMLEALPR